MYTYKITINVFTESGGHISVIFLPTDALLLIKTYIEQGLRFEVDSIQLFEPADS